MSVSRVAIEHALDAIASDEGGMRFQGLAVVLAKLRWPELIACERKWDLGLDAHAPAILSPLHVGMGLSSSTTPELEKIQADAKRAKPHFSDLQILVFVTSGKVTNYTVEKWQAEISDEYDFYTAAEYISIDAEQPSIFQNWVANLVPLGKSVSFPGPGNFPLPMEISTTAFTEAVGYVHDDKFVGIMRLELSFTFSKLTSQTRMALAPRFGIIPEVATITGTGRFELELQSDL
jgi:hypothetical protein